MISKRVSDIFLILLIPCSFIFVTPWNNLDGTNPAKFLVIVSLGMLVFALTIPKTILRLKNRDLKLFQILSLVALAWTFVSLSTNRFSFDERLFGVYGRSLGAITFLSLFAILFAASEFDVARLKFVNFAMLLTLTFVGVYFAVQLLGWDPASWEDAYGGIPSSTLGNPNFVSSSLAILSVPLFVFLFYRTRFGSLFRIVIVPVILAIVFLIGKTQSFQGLLIFSLSIVGIVLVRLNEIFSNRLEKSLKVLVVSAIASIPIFSLLFAMGFVPQIGGATLLARSDYWRAAWNLILANPVFGKGFDSFGDWYLYYRDESAAVRSPGLFTDSTHNLLLELGVFGGLPLLITYLVLQAIALRCALKLITDTNNVHAKALVVAWIGFHLQSAISPSSLALISLGMVLTGIVYAVGNDVPDKSLSVDGFRQLKTKKKRGTMASGLATVATAITISGSGIYFGAVPIVKDAQFRDAIEQGNGQKMIEIARQWPFNYSMSELTFDTLKSNGYDELALKVARELVAKNPTNIRGWRKLSEMANSPAEKSNALAKIKELDPRNPELRN